MKSNINESFMQGVISLIFSQFIIKILGLIYSIYLTNRKGFGDSGNAIYMSGYQIYALLLTISSIGVPNAISKIISEKLAVKDYSGSKRVFKIAFLTFSLIGFFGMIILFMGAEFISNKILQIPEAQYTLIALSPAIFFVSVSSVVRGYYNGKQMIRITAKSQAIEQVFKTILTIAFVEIIANYSNLNTKLMAAGANLATAFATFFSFTYIFLICRKKEKNEKIYSSNNIYTKKDSFIKIIKNILGFSIPMSISSLLSVVNKNIDSITVVRILRNIFGEEIAKNKYGILSTKIDTLTIMPLAFNIAFATALVPAISSAKINNDINIINKRLRFSILITILIGLPCTVGMGVFAEPILKLLFPNASSGAFLLKIASTTIIFTVLTQTINGALQGLGKIKIPAIALSFGVCVKLICNLILIPINGIYEKGAVIGTILCHLTTFFIVYKVLKNTIELNFSIYKMILKPILASLVMITISYSCYIVMLNKLNLIQNVATILSMIIAIIIYFVSIILLKILSKNDFFMLPNGERIYNFLKKINLYK